MDLSELTKDLNISSKDSSTNNILIQDTESLDLGSSNKLIRVPDINIESAPTQPPISITPEVHNNIENPNGLGIGEQNEMQGNKWNSQSPNGKMANKSPKSKLKSQFGKSDSSQIREKSGLKGPWIKSSNFSKKGADDDCHKNKNQLTDQTNTVTTATHWDKFLQCFSVFKPRKGSTDSESNLKVPELRKNMTESDLFLYELSSKSEILDSQITKHLGKHLPPRAIGYPWELTFTTSADGFSLHSLYRKMDKIDSPVLLVIEDIDKRIFGAIVSCAFRVAEGFYGSSDTFLFRASPTFEVFKWSGDNFFFIQGQDDFISIGSDGGKFGLWLDDNLYQGRTEECSTFGSPPLVEEKDFKIKTVECWTVGI